MLRNHWFLLLITLALPAGAGTPKEFSHATLVDRTVVMLDENGQEGPARIGELGRTPFAMLVSVTPKGNQVDLSYCSATHLKGDYLLTAAHCVPASSEATLWVLFYSKEGKRQLFPIRDFYFRGQGNEDIAVAKLGEDAVAAWDEANFRFSPFEKPADSPDVPVTLWSYTPIRFFPEYQQKFPGKAGMVFRPNRCVASQVLPRIVLRERKSKRVTTKISFHEDMKSKDHLFIDKCQHAILEGNSGSLISHGKNFDYKLGVLAFTLGEHASTWRQLHEAGYTKDPTKELIYYGVDGKGELMTYEQGLFSLGAGTLFETIERRNPAALPRP